LALKEEADLHLHLNLKLSHSVASILAIDLNHQHHLLRKEGCSEQGLVQNVEDSFVQVHHEEAV
jgi:hypothetical protein